MRRLVACRPVPASIDYPRVTLYAAAAATEQRSPEAIAWAFFGATAGDRELLASIDTAAAALARADLACLRPKPMINSSGFNVYPAQERDATAQALIGFKVLVAEHVSGAH